MRVVFSVILALIAASAFARAASPYIVVLGVGQDAGIPQMGCDTPFCRQAWSDPKLRQWVSSIALVDPDSKSRWIFDATPDLPAQFEYLKQTTGDRSNALNGIFLTHAHVGHYTGLMYLGRESMNSKDVPVYAMPRMKLMLEANAPWTQLVSLKNIELRALSDRFAGQTSGQSFDRCVSRSASRRIFRNRWIQDQFADENACLYSRHR